jgi:phosphonate transport system substrate-binding protein
MTYHLAISPDVHIRDLADWFLLNTRIQRLTRQTFRVRIYDDVTRLHRAYSEGRIDLAYANAPDCAELIPAGYLPLVRPIGVSDEAAVVVAHDDPAQCVEDLLDVESIDVAVTNAPDVQRICRILLEPADLAPEAVRIVTRPNYTLVAKSVLGGQTRAAFFLRTAFDHLSDAVKPGLRTLVSSQISVISHTLVAAPSLAGLAPVLVEGLLRMNDDPADADLLTGLGAPRGWQRADARDVSLLLDVISALA